MTTTSEKLAADVTALLRARNPLLWVVTREEARVELYLLEAAAKAGYVPHTWDCGQGFADLAGQPESIGSRDPGDALDTVRSRTEGNERGVWILRDFHSWVSGPAGIMTQRQLRNLARMLPGIARDSAQAVIILTPTAEIPPELAGHTTVVEWKLPDRDEIAALLDMAIDILPPDAQKGAATNGQRDAAIDAAVGLTGEEAQACFAKSLVSSNPPRVDPAMIATEKKRIIAASGVIECFDPLPGGIEAVGGLDNLKAWLLARSSAYTPEAREYGLPAPKGALLGGVPGCGKSLTAKAIATAWNVPLLKVDLGALKSKFVGESESNLRKAFGVIEAMGRCVVWFDEIEKSLAGATSGSADGGVSEDALGALLNWMQERQGEAFVIATANKVENLPPELLRKGRFDEVWWIDLPNRDERIEIAAAALRANRRPLDEIDLGKIADATDGFTGSEIAAIIPEAMFAAYADNARPIWTDDILVAAETVTPLTKTAADKIEALRTWAKERGARPATSATAKTKQSAGRVLDI